jgi:two-component system sensor histidine kinase KdpD
MAQRRAEDFLELVERSKRGRLKVYLGYAAGVGKTYRMLEEAHALKKRGVDVVIGFIETHLRAETQALVPGLEQVPTRTVEYRGVSIAEMDLEAVIRRRPQVALVDEVAHTNAPTSKNRRRYQDVQDLLAEGINVICAFNIQHLESLNDLIFRSTGVTVRETVPDTFLKQADQVVTLDLAIEDLQERLASGKIYAAEKVTQALQNFFKGDNLSALRELALREVAESLDRASASGARGKSDEPHPRPTRQRVMVCMASSPPRAAELLRRGSRMAGRYNTDWFVVYVQTPQEAPHRINSETQRHLLANIQMAKELGAEVVRVEAVDPVAGLIDFARSHGVGHIVIGRSRESWWRQLIGRSVMLRMVREAAGFDLHILSVEAEEIETDAEREREHELEHEHEGKRP